MNNEKDHATITITGGNNVIATQAASAPQCINAPGAAQPVMVAAQPTDTIQQMSATIRHYITHDAVGVPELIRQARRHIVLHAAFYPKYGFDNQGDDISKTMAKNPGLRLTAIFTDVNTPWIDEFAVTLRDYFAEKGTFSKHLEITKDYFIRLRNLYSSKRVHIYDTARLPLFPVILIDDTLIVGHYAHSCVIPPNGLWFTIKHPKIPAMYECLLAGGNPECDTSEESAILRYLEELIL